MRARGLGDSKDQRVILLREWDSIYARTFAESLKDKLKEKGVTLEIYSYLRGLDGATVDGAPKQQRLVPRSSDKDGDRKPRPEIEWPESRDQRDYVRRLVASIEKGAARKQDPAPAGGNKATAEAAKGRVVAIGMIGADVHDKLILAQALRVGFPDRMLFTTDLDARFMHPEVLKYTRNLVVASSLPLVPDEPQAIGTAPFRDSYQTAVYRAAYYAASSNAGIPPEPTGRLFEIGNDGEVELGTAEVLVRETEKRWFNAAAALAVLVVLGWLMLFAKPAPAMRTALSGSAPADERTDDGVERAPDGFATALMSGFQAAAWGFALAVVIELAFPGLVGPWRALAIAAAFALSFWAVVYLGLRTARAGGKLLAVLATGAALVMIAACFAATLALLPEVDSGPDA